MLHNILYFFIFKHICTCRYDSEQVSIVFTPITKSYSASQELKFLEYYLPYLQFPIQLFSTANNIYVISFNNGRYLRGHGGSLAIDRYR